MVECYAGEPKDKGKSDINMCIFVPSSLDFGLICTIDPATGHPVAPAAGTTEGMYISGFDDGVRTTGNTQHFWTNANSIWVQTLDNINAGAVVYVAGDGSGKVTGVAASSVVGSIPIGVATEGSENKYINRNKDEALCVKINWTGRSGIAAL